MWQCSLYVYVCNVGLLLEMKCITQNEGRLIDGIYVSDLKCFSHIHVFNLLSAAVMKNTGVLFANDVNAERIKAVIGNFHRLGVVNSVVSCCDGRKFSAVSLGQLCPLLMCMC